MTAAPSRPAFSTFVLVVLGALLAVSACDSSGTVVEEVVACDARGAAEPVDDFLATDLAVHLESGGDPGLEIVRQDMGRYLGRLWSLPGLAVTSAPPDFTKRVTVWLSTSEAARARQRAKQRKLSPAERKRRKRGRAR